MMHSYCEWRWVRWALFAAGLSLAFYLPYRYAVRPPVTPGLYTFLFPLSAVVAACGILLAFRPALVFRLPYAVRAGIGAVALLWFVAGMVCVPALGLKILVSPMAGSLAALQMLVQHVFLSVVAGAFALKPRETFQWFGLTLPMIRLEDENGSARSRARV